MAPVPSAVKQQLLWLRTIRGAIVLGFAAFCLLIAALGGGAVLTVRRAGRLITHSFDTTVMATSYAGSAAADWASIESATVRPLPGESSYARAEAIQRLTAGFQVLNDDLNAALQRVQEPPAVQAGQGALRTTAECGRLAERSMTHAADADWAGFADCSSEVSGQIELFVTQIANEGFRAREQVMVVIDRDVQGGAAATLLVLGLAAWVKWRLARRLIGPLAAASSVARRIAAGHFDTSIPDGGPDELGSLFGAMTLMRDSVRAKIASEETQRRDASDRLDAALDNMGQGLALYDADDRLRLANRRLAEIYRLSPNYLRPGTHLNTMLQGGIEAGIYGTATLADLLKLRSNLGSEWRDTTGFLPLADGRVIRVVRRRLPEGGWVSTHEDITEHKEAEARAEFLVRHDALTGLANRARFTERLLAAAKALAEGGSFAVLLIDLDRFKQINDVLGHTLGDRLLCAAADRLAARLREADIVARLGGDEFAVIQSGIERPVAASSLAGQVMSILAEPFDIDGRRLSTGACVGIAMAPAHGAVPDMLLRSAETALSHAKLQGPGTLCFFDPDAHAQGQRPRELEANLRTADIEQDFELLYQPVFDAELSGINGFEALLRWNHPTLGVISPAEFIPISERTGLIAPIGHWVLRQAARQAAAWPAPLGVAVNVSAVQFRSGQLVGQVRDALAESGLAPARLELEITETVLLQDSVATLATLHQLHALGVHIALDDFGTGYSSLSYLRSFPFDRIKIDQCFVRDLGKSRDSLAIIRAIASLSRDLGIRATAEGVETVEQFEELCRERCSEMQGYYFSRPVRPAMIEQLLQRWGLAASAAFANALQIAVPGSNLTKGAAA